ncbi:hypothetical protein ColLi_05951 [Colletotrichum liriopes]|uniref:BTB domain-containing protein n=1 Tax=Colletotrichum liriopes TaxID=708192 RepID=A0AA37LT75_9PEZI|nr:hypothetical protein ColLi_05951 [Colletotrichum liriopes]
MSGDSGNSINEPRASQATTANMIDPAWLFLLPNPEELVTLKCGEKSFSFRKSILIKDSEYFTTCLANTAFVEARTLTIEFQDIEPELLGFYLHMVYSKATGKEIDATSVLFGSDTVTSLRGGLATMVKLYQMADRFLNKPLLADLESAIIHFAEHGSCPVQAFPVRPEKLSPDQSHMNNPTMLAELVWWTKTYRDAYAALERNKTDQDGMRTRLVDIFCRKVPAEVVVAITPIISESRDFIQAVLSYVAHKNYDFKTKVKTLEQEVKTLQKLNETSSNIEALWTFVFVI